MIVRSILTLLYLNLINFISLTNLRLQSSTEINTDTDTNTDTNTLSSDFTGLEKTFVFSIFRHGARAPYYMKEDNIDSLGKKWNLNKQELTNVGMRQHYVLGMIQKETHKDLLSKDYSLGEVYAMSTNVNRTIQSFMAHFQGLYPDGPVLSKEQEKHAWPPGKFSDEVRRIAEQAKGAVGDKINSMPFHLFESTYMNFKCDGIPDYTTEGGESLDKNINEFRKKYDKLLKEKFKIDLENKTSKEARPILWDFADTYIAEYYEGLTDYFTDLDEESKFLDDVVVYCFKDMLDVSYSDKNYYNGRVLISQTFDDLINSYLKRRIILNDSKVYNSTDPKMLIYSAHDINIAQVMVFLKYAFEIEFNYKINYASVYNFELYRKVEKIDKSGEGKEESFKLRITYNGEQVYFEDYSKFKVGVEKALISYSEINSYCGLKSNSIVTLYIIVIVILSALILGLFVYLGVGFFKKPKSNPDLTTHLGGGINSSA